MKQIFLIISVFCSLGMSAQDITTIDKILDEISIITSVPRHDVKQKINHGDGVVRYVHNEPIGKEFICSEECGTDPITGMTTENVKVANEKNKEIFDAIFHAIGHNLDSLMEVADESYHYETHKDGIETIHYSVCIKNGKDCKQKVRAEDGTMIFPDALEMAFFDFTTSKKPCGKHVRGFGTLGYNKNIYLPDRKSCYFDKESYLSKLMPILKQKGIKSWDFKWATSEDYDIDANWRKEFRSGERINIKTADGRKSNAGQTIGTMFFIPRENKEMAEEIMSALDSMTLNYTDIHPEQMFHYVYNTAKTVIKSNKNFTEMFAGTTGKNYSTRVLFGITPQGYYVTVADVENNFCIPKEWSKLKSFIDGKKKYIKCLKSE